MTTVQIPKHLFFAVILALVGCRRESSVVAKSDVKGPYVEICKTQLLTPLRPASLEFRTHVFVDNPSIAVSDNAVAIAGSIGLQYRLRAARPSLEVDSSSVARIFGLLRRQGGSLEAIPASPLHLGASGTPLLRLGPEAELDAVWRSAGASDPASSWQLNQGRWVSGKWTGLKPLIAGLGEEVLSQLNTSRAFVNDNASTSYLSFGTALGRQARLLRNAGAGWELGSARALPISDPSLVIFGRDDAVVLGLAGRPPFGNTVVAYPLGTSTGPPFSDYRVSDSTLPVVQKPFGFRDGDKLVALFAGGLSDREDRLFATVSRDSGRSWSDRTDVYAGGNILAWDAAQHVGGRAVALVNVSPPGGGGKAVLQMMLFDSERLRWDTLWRADSTISAFGVPAIASNGRQLHIAFSAESRTIVGWPETYLLSFDITCRTSQDPAR